MGTVINLRFKMILILLLSLTLTVTGHQVTHKFTSVLINLGKDIATASPEMPRLAAVTYASGLAAHQAAVKESCPSDCPNFVELSAAFAMYSVVKNAAPYVAFSGNLHTTFVNILNSYPCEASSLARARNLGHEVAKEKIKLQLDDDFIAYYQPEQDRPDYLASEITATPVPERSHWAYSKLLCFDADPKSLFPVTPCPNIDSHWVKEDWIDTLTNGNINAQTPERNATANFYYAHQLGDGEDSSDSIGSKFFLFGRQVIERQCGNDLGKELKYYTILATVLSNTMRAVFSNEYFYNSYPLLKIMTQQTYPGYPYNSNWNSLEPVNNPNYPNRQTAVNKAFAVFTTTFFGDQNINVYSNLAPTRHFANLRAFYDDMYNGLFWGGVALKFSLQAGAQLGENVANATIKMLTEGQCPTQYAI